jgi:hypothetical protein
MIKLGELIAPRFWIACDRYKQLCGPARMACWPYDRPMSGEDIQRNNSVGVYAFKDKSRIYDYIEQNRNQMLEFLKCEPYVWMQPTGVVIGTVRLWGHIVPSQFGYRAQFGRVHTLDDIIELPQLIRRRTEGADLAFLRQHYGVADSCCISSVEGKMRDSTQ